MAPFKYSLAIFSLYLLELPSFFIPYLLQLCWVFLNISGNWFCELIYLLLLTWKSDTCFVLFRFQGPNSIMIVLVMLLNIGLAILFVHFLT